MVVFIFFHFLQYVLPRFGHSLQPVFFLRRRVRIDLNHFIVHVLYISTTKTIRYYKLYELYRHDISNKTILLREQTAFCRAVTNLSQLGFLFRFRQFFFQIRPDADLAVHHARRSKVAQQVF